MIRVLQVPHSMNRGGIETMLMNYYRELDKNKIQFDFLITDFNKCDYEDEIKLLGGRIYRIHHIRDGIFKYLKDLKDFFKKHANEYNIVHAHTSSRSFFPLYYAKKYGIKNRIAHSHNSIGSQDMDGFIRDLLKFPLKFVVTDRFACSKKASVWLYGKKVTNSNKVTILKNAIDASKFDYNVNIRNKMRSEFQISNNTLVIGHIGRFMKQKNHVFLLDIFCEILKKNSNSILILVGTGELIDLVKNKTNEMNLTDKVIFLGVRKDINDILQMFDIFVLPSLYEGLPVTGIEAQASGLPCVFSDTITNETNITGLVTYLSLNQSAQEWANMCISQVKSIERDKMYPTIVKAGYDIKCNVKTLEKIYLQLYGNEK